MLELQKNERYKLQPLYADMKDSLIKTCLQGIKGNAWADSIENPRSAMLYSLGFCYLAGIPDNELLEILAEKADIAFIISETPEWETLVRDHFSNNAVFKYYEGIRFAIKKEGNIFDLEKLKRFATSVPEGYTIKRYDEAAYRDALSEEWSKYSCFFYDDYNEFRDHAIAYAAYFGDELVCSASTYSYYDRGIEIEIDTKEGHKRKGLATACAASLILEALSKGLCPNWDAANKISVALSEKLGFHFDKEYLTQTIIRNES